MSNAAANPRFDVMKYTAPAAWATFLLNNDDSGLEESDLQAARAFAESLPGGIVSVDTEGDDAPGFTRWHDAREWSPYAAECAAYIVLVERE